MKGRRTTNWTSPGCSSVAVSPCGFDEISYRWAAIALLLLGVIQVGLAPVGAADAAAPIRFRVGFAKSSLGDIPNNDLMAALGVWTTTLLQEIPFPVETSVTIQSDPKALRDLYGAQQIDGVSLGAEEFLALKARPDFVYAIQRNGSLRSRYLLLARKDSSVTLEDALGNKSIQFHRASATCLVSVWIESLRAGQTTAGRFRGRDGLEEIQGMSKAILRVFFKQAELCVATEGAFVVASEMNPQIATALKVLARSPELIPSAFFLHEAIRPDLRTAIEKRIVELDLNTRGKQVLTVFQGDRMVKVPLAEWQPTLDLVREWKSRLAPSAPDPATVARISEPARRGGSP
ncbi:MAG: PhnD/SsuA/transferrin family substrate-binding protein [Verrucomicrobiales bacterium]|nr:PhnD/SsuA/transferrin family substrate-binding protein [Verrucomicrobiales bacterium]